MNPMQFVLFIDLLRIGFAHRYLSRNVADVYNTSVVDRITSHSEMECAIKCHQSSKGCGAYVLKDHVCTLISKDTEFCKGDEQIWLKDSQPNYDEAVLLLNGIIDSTVGNPTVESYPANLKLPNMTAELKFKASVAFFDGKIYSCGGSLQGSNDGTKDCNVLGSSGSWEAGPSMINDRLFFTLTTVGTRLVAMGGFTFFGGLGVISSAEFLEPNGEWTALDDVNPPRSFHCSVPFSDTEMIISGGKAKSDGYDTLTTVQKFNVYDGTITPLTSLTKVRREHGCLLIDQNILIVAGGNDGKSNAQVYSDIEKLDISTSTWTTLTSLPLAYTSVWVENLGGKMYVWPLTINSEEDFKLYIFTFNKDNNSGHWHDLPVLYLYPRKYASLVKVTATFRSTSSPPER